MQRDAIVTLLAQQCGDRDDLNNIIISNMDIVQSVELEQSGSTPWFLYTEDATASTVANEKRIPVPSDFLLELDEDRLEVYNSDLGRYVPVTKGTKDELEVRYGAEAAGLPEKYALSGDYFILFPTPDAVYTLRMKYAAAQALPSSGNIENKWMKHAPDLLIALTGLRVASKHLQNTELAAQFRGDVVTARARLHTMQTAREEANRERSMGDS